jgi:hypothetical protein
MTVEILKQMSKDDVLDFIRQRRTITKEDFSIEKLRFDFDARDTKGTIHNMNILNLFADLGIYDYTNYLFLNSRKGNFTLYMFYWSHESIRNAEPEDMHLIFDEYGGWSTSEIIYDVFEKTIFSNEPNKL